jgi:hypothetical protein
MNIEEAILDYCNAAVQIGKDSYNVDFDFAPDTVKQVSEILDHYHDIYAEEGSEGDMHQRINTYAGIFGIYVGEVLRRNYASDYNWESTENGFGLTKGNSGVFPIAKAYKHIQNGVEGGDRIDSFFDIAVLIVQGKFPK